MQAHNQRLTTRVTIGGVIALGIIAIAFASIAWNLISINSSVSYLSSHVVRQAMDSSLFNAVVFRTIAESESFGRARKSADRQETLDALRGTKDMLAELEQLANDHPSAASAPDHADQLALQRQRQEMYAQLEPLVKNVLAAAEMNDNDQLRTLFAQMETFERTTEAIEDRSSELTGVSVRYAEEMSAQATQRTIVLAVGLFALLCLMGLTITVLIRREITQPIGQLAAAAGQVGAGNLDPYIAEGKDNEIGQLQQAFRSMLASLRSSSAQLIEHQHTLEHRVAERTAELRQALAEREQLIGTVRGLSSPVVPISDGVLAMPLIGVIDDARAADILEVLLGVVEQRRARHVLLDVTGVPLIDTQVAAMLIRSADAARLLGARVALVGLRPELAQTIVGLGIDIAHLPTYPDLQTGLRAIERAKQKAVAPLAVGHDR